MTTGPSPGVLNHSVAEKYISTAAANRNDDAADEQPALHLAADRHGRQHADDGADGEGRRYGYLGIPRKSLNPMAPNSFSRTATQKIGREKNRKAMKVTP